MNNKMGKSIAEESFNESLRASGFNFVREFKFHPKRRWRVDFFILHESSPLAIEVEGITSYGSHLGRHQSAKGFEADCEKYAELLIAGYSLLRVTPRMVMNGIAIHYVNKFFVTNKEKVNG